MPPLIIERYSVEDSRWRHIVDIYPGERDGSLSSHNPDGSRDIYLFGVDLSNREGFVKKSIAGIDKADSKTRAVTSLGFEAVATLSNNESYEIEIVTDASGGESRRIRFTYLED